MIGKDVMMDLADRGTALGVKLDPGGQFRVPAFADGLVSRFGHDPVIDLGDGSGTVAFGRGSKRQANGRPRSGATTASSAR